MLSLESRRKYLEAITLYKIVNNNFDCIDLISGLGYYVPRTVYKREVHAGKLFYLNTCRTNAGLRMPLRRMTESYNVHFVEIDIFANSTGKFKSHVLKKLCT